MDSLICVSRDKSTQIVSASRQNPLTLSCALRNRSSSQCTSIFRVSKANSFFYTCQRSIVHPLYHTRKTDYLTLPLRLVHERVRNPV